MGQVAQIETPLFFLNFFTSLRVLDNCVVPDYLLDEAVVFEELKPRQTHLSVVDHAPVTVDNGFHD